MIKFLRINPSDNVAVAIEPLEKGEQIVVDGKEMVMQTEVPAGHKFLLMDLKEGEDVVKYGYPIGRLKEGHRAGEWVDDRHIKTNLKGLLSYEYKPVFTAEQIAKGEDAKVDVNVEGLPVSFKGYRRRNGDVGIRNELWIVPTVGCVNGIVNQLADRIKSELDLSNSSKECKGFKEFKGVKEFKEFEVAGIDRVAAFPHNYGCSQLSEDHENTRKVLRDIVLHPNAGGVLIVGLGCENNQPHDFMKLLGDYDQSRVKLLVTQEVDGDEVEEGMKLLRELAEEMKKDVRQDVPLSELRIGLKCGGSDGFSGITANPLLGVLSDYVVSLGGTTVLTEVPEMFGAETILMNRCADESLFNQTVKLVNDFKDYFLSHGEPVGENPSPGNKKGGISTLEDKALGCTQKCGKSAVKGVLAYGERLETKGLNLLSAPGNDLVASTALAASGCHMVLFTTGRGTPFGTFVPTVKISTNSILASRKPMWIDFNAGSLVEGNSMQQVFAEFVNKVVAVANGEPTWNERKNYQEIAIFKNGVTL